MTIADDHPFLSATRPHAPERLLEQARGLPRPRVALVNAGAATTAKWLGFFAVILAFINIVGGFGITQRMLGTYRRRQD